MKTSKLLCLLLLAALSSPTLAEPTYRVVKTDAEWRKILSPEAYSVLRKGGTEAPHSGEYVDETRKGTYACVGCGEVLFQSTTKFDSHCGWPSFYKPAGQKAVQEKVDKSHNMVRTEILCSGCGGHLGHVFDDGPPPTNLRYCINSDALVFRPAPKPK
jgi:peptide-methionine (R)-S-oxide reductase